MDFIFAWVFDIALYDLGLSEIVRVQMRRQVRLTSVRNVAEFSLGERNDLAGKRISFCKSKIFREPSVINRVYYP